MHFFGITTFGLEDVAAEDLRLNVRDSALSDVVASNNTGVVCFRARASARLLEELENLATLECVAVLQCHVERPELLTMPTLLTAAHTCVDHFDRTDGSTDGDGSADSDGSANGLTDTDGALTALGLWTRAHGESASENPTVPLKVRRRFRADDVVPSDGDVARRRFHFFGRRRSFPEKRHAFNGPDAFGAMAQHVRPRVAGQHDARAFHLGVLVHVYNGSLHAGLCIRADLHQRRDRSHGLKTALNPSLAAALALLGRRHVTDGSADQSDGSADHTDGSTDRSDGATGRSDGSNLVIGDPMCGTGTTLVEAARFFPRARLIGSDVDSEAIQVAQQQSQLTQCAPQCVDICDNDAFDAFALQWYTAQTHT
ncbi:MAG: hypothetical protein MHM6MM_001870 [Cercozoa sp. M6MM]